MSELENVVIPNDNTSAQAATVKIPAIANKEVEVGVHNIHQSLLTNAKELIDTPINQWFSGYIVFISSIKSKTLEISKQGNLSSLFSQIKIITDNFHKDELAISSNYLAELSSSYLNGLSHIKKELPQEFVYLLTATDLYATSLESKEEVKAKSKKKSLSKFGIKPTVVVPFRTIASYHLDVTAINNFKNFQLKLGLFSKTIQEEIQHQINQVVQKGTLYEADVNQAFGSIVKLVEEQKIFSKNYLLQSATFISRQIAIDASLIGAKELANVYQNTKHQISPSDLTNYASYWLKNQQLFTLFSSVDLSLAELNLSVNSKRRVIEKEIQTNLHEPVKSALNSSVKLLEKLAGFIPKNNWDEVTKESFEITTEIETEVLVVNQLMTDLRELVSKIPEEVKVLDERSKSNFSKEQTDEIRTVKVDLKVIINYLIENNLVHPLEEQLVQIAQRYNNLFTQINHNLQLISFCLSTKVELKSQTNVITDAIDKATKGLTEIELLLNEEKKTNDAFLESVFESVSTCLNTTYITSQASELKSSSRKAMSKTGLRWMQKTTQKLDHLFDRYSKVLSSKREDILYASFIEDNEQSENWHSKVLSFTETKTPKTKVLEDVPLFYQQLFIGKHNVNFDFIKHRERETKEAEKALQRIENGIDGGILVIGEHLSGKSFFSEVIAKKSGKKVFKIDPPTTGSSSSKDLLRILKNQIGSNKNTTDEKIILEAPKGSVFIFNDIELWWERQSGLTDAFQVLIKLVKRYSNRYIFIMNCNSHALKIIKQQSNFLDYFISTIQLSPFSHIALQQTIFSRHDAGGLDFSIDGILEHDLKEKKKEQLIDKYLTVSKGNIGVALHLWQANISTVQDGVLALKFPNASPLPTLKDEEALILLKEFIIHKSLNVQRIKRIFKLKNQEEAAVMLLNLKRSGLLEETLSGAFKISPYLVGFVTQSLKSQHLI